MDNPLIDLLRRCTVQLPGRGTGFFVAPHLILTCAHVLKGLKVKETIKVNRKSTSISATIEALTSDDWPDLGLLRVDGAPGEAWVLLDADLAQHDPVHAFGFPKHGGREQRTDGIAGRFEDFTWQRLAAEAPAERWPDRPLIKFKDALVVGGYSGSALLNLRSGRAVGVVSETINGAAAVGGWAVPAAIVLECLEDVADAQRGHRDAALAQWDKALQDADAGTAQQSARLRGLALQPPLDSPRRRSQAQEPLPAALRFLYESQLSSFHGRTAEIAALRNVLTAPARFAWQSIAGPNGSGKSRLVQEVLLQAAPAWTGGFLPLAAKPWEHWEAWQPLRPTVIVIDDAAARAVEARDIVETLARRARSNGLGWPVRLVLVDRQTDFMEAGVGDLQKSRLAESRHGEKLDLRPLDDQALAETMRDLGPVDDERMAGLLKALKRVDDQRRPLFALLLADAAASGLDPSGTSRIDLLREHVLQREWTTRWDPIGVDDDDTAVLAFATVCPPLYLKDVAKAAEAGAPLPRKLDAPRRARVAAMLGSGALSQWVPSLRPDLLGTLFVLDTQQRMANVSEADASGFVSAAWKTKPFATRQLVLRALEEMPSHPAIERFLLPPPDNTEAVNDWADAASTACTVLQTLFVELMGAMSDVYCRTQRGRVLCAILDVVGFNTHGLLAEDDRPLADSLFHSVLALPLPHEIVRDVSDFKSADFSAWDVRLSEIADGLYAAHMRAEDEAAAERLVEALTEKAALLPDDAMSKRVLMAVPDTHSREKIARASMKAIQDAARSAAKLAVALLAVSLTRAAKSLLDDTETLSQEERQAGLTLGSQVLQCIQKIDPGGDTEATTLFANACVWVAIALTQIGESTKAREIAAALLGTGGDGASQADRRSFKDLLSPEDCEGLAVLAEIEP
ncbi:trypsin-like peptidase domain-containing protein [Vineibacter terrae]|uniref:Trypsin-like peptidase domain-containing protein n=1 Tax=Vineibacter terrae TaxID=2586908 RepID=A0A5C8PUG7_9HYPH|nr:serine protease [Vineibacter terrae]TXL81721.1 trypsin-like peptidase domain-containing protein [Vineibacter terrae]